ncbi:MAG TPA: acetyltransferase [Acidothermaceae bacterium]|nr:acetyltransferase [Acidothermaceae bacterium]
MTPPLVIVGAGGFARETAQAVDALNSSNPTWDLLGFVDDDPALAGHLIDGVKVLGPLDALGDLPDVSVVVCTGRPDNYFSRRRIVERLAFGSDRFATIVHPSCAIAADVQIGAGSVLLAHVTATAAVTISDHVAVMPQSVLTHDDHVHDYVTVASGVRLGGAAVIEAGAYLGSGVLVREGVRIGAWSLVGMGSVVLHDVPAAQVWFGAPARMVRTVELPEQW